MFDISFIVPIHNTEKYLEQCLNSITIQKDISYEVILINDGSSDNSLLICENYKNNNKNIKIIDTNNKGVSVARNLGINESKGEYVCFLDSDDYYIEDFTSNLLFKCKNNDLDIIRGWYKVFDENSITYRDCSHSVSYINKVLNGYDFLKLSINEKANEVVPWIGFFRREYIIKNNLYFPEGISYEEDQLFFLDALLCDKKCKIMQCNELFYAYRYRKDSATKTPSLKQAKDVAYIVNKENELINKYELSSEIIKAAKKYISSSFYQLTSIYGRVDNKYKKEIANLVSFKTKWQCIINSYDLHQKIKILLFTFARGIVDIVYHIRGFV